MPRQTSCAHCRFAGPFWSQGAVALVLQVNQENYLVQLENGQHKVTSRLKDLRRKVRTSEQRATLSRATRPPRDQTRSGLETPTRRATALDPPAVR